MKSIADLFRRLYNEIWLALGIGYRVLLLLLVLVAAGAVIGVVHWSTRPDFEVLSTNLRPEEAAQLIDALNDAGIHARLSRDGDAVLTPRNQRHQARMVAAGEGLAVVSLPGFEMFRDPKIGMTPFAERINYLSALQNELAATIMSIDSVLHARVHLAIPERQLFRDDARRASASVLVTTRSAQRLGRGEAQAIANLVASAVDELAPGDVTITDSRGHVVAGADRTVSDAMADEQFVYRQRVEQHLAHKAESMLARVIGPGRSEVRVSADIDFQDERSRRKLYDSENQVLVSERITTSSSRGAGLRVGGRVGESAGEVDDRGGADQETRQEDIDTRYLVGESVTESVRRGALINRLSVAALVDMGSDADRAPIGLDEVTAVIEEAVGIDRGRGDTLRIARASFFQEDVSAADVLRSPWLQSLARYLALAVFGVILLVIAKRLLKSIETTSLKRRDVLVPEVLAEGEDAGGEAAWGVHAEEMLRRQVTRLVEEDPETAGRLLETWIESERFAGE